jgi:tetratricopeptide (TPR) repeat protein
VDRVKTEADELMQTGDIESALGRVEDLLRRFPMASEVREHRDELKTALAKRRVDHLVQKSEAAAPPARSARRSTCSTRRSASTRREDVRARRDEHAQRLARVAESRQKAAQALASGRFEEAFSLATEVLRVTPGDAAMEEVRRKSQASVESVDQFLQRGQDPPRREAPLGRSRGVRGGAVAPPGDKSLSSSSRARGNRSPSCASASAGRRLMPNATSTAAKATLTAVLADLPDDAESKSLLAACERGREEVARRREIDADLARRPPGARGRLRRRVREVPERLALEPAEPGRGARREHVEQRLRGERDIRELANEHLHDGRFPTRSRRSSGSRRSTRRAPRRQGGDRGVQEARGADQGRAAPRRGGARAKEYRRAQEASAACSRSLRGIPRERDQEGRRQGDRRDRALPRRVRPLLLAEMFDEALDALDKAKERGAIPEEYKPRRDTCEQGRLALLKTDATRSLVAKDYEAAIAAYEQVLEVSARTPTRFRASAAPSAGSGS